MSLLPFLHCCHSHLSAQHVGGICQLRYFSIDRYDVFEPVPVALPRNNNLPAMRKVTTVRSNCGDLISGVSANAIALGLRDRQSGMVETENGSGSAEQSDAIRVEERIEKCAAKREGECSPHHIPSEVPDVSKPDPGADAYGHNRTRALQRGVAFIIPRDS